MELKFVLLLPKLNPNQLLCELYLYEFLYSFESMFRCSFAFTNISSFAFAFTASRWMFFPADTLMFFASAVDWTTSSLYHSWLCCLLGDHPPPVVQLLDL